jgi:hypothetical protein
MKIQGFNLCAIEDSRPTAAGTFRPSKLDNEKSFESSRETSRCLAYRARKKRPKPLFPSAHNATPFELQ